MAEVVGELGRAAATPIELSDPAFKVVGLVAFLIRIFSRGSITETATWSALTRWATTLVA